MLFNSLHFLIFFPVVFFVYHFLPQRGKTYFLLAASYYFYMVWEPSYALLILASTVVDYFVALKLPKVKAKKALLMLSLATNLGLLFTFKYFNFFSRSLESMTEWMGSPLSMPSLDVLLPVGISFYTFQTLSYTIDVYRGKLKPTKDFIQFSLYVSFFPQLVAGPIERATHLLPQLEKNRKFTYENGVKGLRQVLWGFFKKLVIADHVSLYVDEVFNNPEAYGGFGLLLGAYFFAFQIYCDFSGYSDIAIGTARMFGIDLMQNFRRPYFAKNISDFWSRWHISLSTWFRDYVYIPLGGNRKKSSRVYFNVFMVFLVSGLWHGANWTFVVWGAIHGLVTCMERLGPIKQSIEFEFQNKWLQKFKNLAMILVTFHFVVLAWIFFRANNVEQAWVYLARIFSEPTLIPRGIDGFSMNNAVNMILLMEVIHFFQEKKKTESLHIGIPWGWRWAAYVSLSLIIFFYGKFDQQTFIYFQF